MAWTDERTELTKKLWADGLSASQIAVELGGVTRNGVIGKIHRLGLSGRAKSPSIRPRQPRQSRLHGSNLRRPSIRGLFNTTFSPAGIKAEPVVETEIVIPFAQRKTLMQLTDKTCHWPVGDPANPDFFYCGGDTYGDFRYCAFHCRVAHKPSGDRHSVKAPYRARGGAAA
jgi:GcrA cell cycle regulator